MFGLTLSVTKFTLKSHVKIKTTQYSFRFSRYGFTLFGSDSEPKMH